jgi:dihydrofolate reductase
MAKASCSILVAMDHHNHIGSQGDMPWGRSQKDDLKRFREITIGKPVIMGRKTYDSIGKPLAGRTNIVVTRAANELSPVLGVQYAGSIESAIELANEIATRNDDSEFYVIGGGEIYRQALPFTDYLYVTHFLGDFGGDTTFPVIDSKEWECFVKRPGPMQSDDNPHATEYRTYHRK